MSIVQLTEQELIGLRRIEIEVYKNLNIYLQDKPKSTTRAFMTTLSVWEKWCSDNGIHKLEMSYRNIKQFLGSFDVKRKSKMAYLGHLKRFILLVYDATGNEVFYRYIQVFDTLYSPSKILGSAISEPVERIYLTNEQTKQAINYFRNDNTD